jgi:hypothetical protein
VPPESQITPLNGTQPPPAPPRKPRPLPPPLTNCGDGD